MKKSEGLPVGIGLLDLSPQISSNSSSSGLNRPNERMSCTYEGTDGLQGTRPLLLSSGGIGGGEAIGPFVLSSGGIGVGEGTRPFILSSSGIGVGEGIGPFVFSSSRIGGGGGVGSSVLSSGGIGALEVLACPVLSSGLDGFLGDSAGEAVGSGGGCTLALPLEGFFSWLILLAKSATSFRRLLKWINLEANSAPRFAMITFHCSSIAYEAHQNLSPPKNYAEPIELGILQEGTAIK